MTPEALQKILADHLEWIGSLGERGTRANLYGANLTRANLYGANLTRANLEGANLYGAKLTRANLYGANLEGANLTRANLYGANLTRASLEGANLEGAKLGKETKISPETRLPTGELWSEYLAEVVPALCTAGGRKLEEVAGHWDCHTWENCPMAAAFGVQGIEEIPLLFRPRAQQFVPLFDAGLIPCPVARSEAAEVQP
ncbi:pentapeptide repeat-containing protein [Gloeobacter kilaueensis]|uniref:Pentapeptide repeat-containing protein n=1 Tax=Gloeobacter kilaueensis (strain ATCC BAA-2537 / CCAP 1431/1 / ULC 316 / JS1) TaxID=1183438 RepID=U5QDX1_GLOK1|nr:pentapeptide repeat-containing protein [Gloeobacter kilaueensis]AGY57116.1 pentapeptide repeat-containing protein [Gloeobacter kilaueensis JS1]